MFEPKKRDRSPTVEIVPEEEISEPKSYVYRSNWDFGLGLKPITKRGVPDGAGGFSHMVTVPAVRIAFVNCMCVLDEAMAKHLGYPLETLVEWMEMQPGFGQRYFRADKVTPEELAKAGKSKIKVEHGVRTTARDK